MRRPTRGGVSSFLICELRLSAWWKIPKCYQLSSKKRVMALAFIVDKTTYRNEVNIILQEYVNYYVTHFLKWRPFEAKTSLLHNHVFDQNLSEFPFYKTAFVSSTSPQVIGRRWRTSSLTSFISSKMHVPQCFTWRPLKPEMFRNILLPLVLIWLQCRCKWR